MKIIKENREETYIKEKSKFIGLVYKVNNKEEVNEILNKCKIKHPLATHICYAYILPNAKKYSDDNEPMKTAGLPILTTLEKNDLNYVLAIVVRYFGGIKLGSNGLIRAYSNTISLAIADNIKEIEYAYIVHIEEDYSMSKQIDYLLKDCIIISKEYQDKISIKAIIKKDDLQVLSNINYQIEKEIII